VKIELCPSCAQKAATAALELLLDRVTDPAIPDPPRYRPQRETRIPAKELDPRIMAAAEALSRDRTTFPWHVLAARAGCTRGQLTHAARRLIAEGKLARVGTRGAYTLAKPSKS